MSKKMITTEREPITLPECRAIIKYVERFYRSESHSEIEVCKSYKGYPGLTRLVRITEQQKEAEIEKYSDNTDRWIAIEYASFYWTQQFLDAVCIRPVFYTPEMPYKIVAVKKTTSTQKHFKLLK